MSAKNEIDQRLTTEINSYLTDCKARNLSLRTRQALARYLRVVKQPGKLWQPADGEPIKYSGLRQIIRRRAVLAGIPTPPLHAFRRAFAINALRNGMDVITLQRLLGHSNLDVIRRYLAQVEEDLSDSHGRFWPVNSL